MHSTKTIFHSWTRSLAQALLCLDTFVCGVVQLQWDRRGLARVSMCTPGFTIIGLRHALRVHLHSENCFSPALYGSPMLKREGIKGGLKLKRSDLAFARAVLNRLRFTFKECSLKLNVNQFFTDMQRFFVCNSSNQWHFEEHFDEIGITHWAQIVACIKAKNFNH